MSSEDLIATQLQHTIDLFRFEVAALRATIEHQAELYKTRLEALEAGQRDHEARLRQVQDAATQFKTMAALATGGGLLSVILLIRELIK
jgi:chaperonin cofactor prefoldin